MRVSIKLHSLYFNSKADSTLCVVNGKVAFTFSHLADALIQSDLQYGSWIALGKGRRIAVQLTLLTISLLKNEFI